MKYEMIFGDEKLFDGVPEYVEFIRYNSYSRDYLWGDLNVIHHLAFKELTALPIVAMRRIIQEPKRWTVEDQKAGRLPEVGCLVFGLNGRGECEVVASEKNELALRHVSTRNLMLVTVSAFNRNFKPLETPEEKAERLRSEWVDDAYGNTCVFGGTDECENQRLKAHLRSVYDSILSGTLSVPTKGGE